MQISFTQGVREGVRLPRYRLLVMAPFSPAVRDSLPLALGASDLNAALKALAPRLTLPVDNLLSDQGTTWWLEMAPTELADLNPAALIRNIPELQWIDGLRAAIAAVANGQAALEALPGQLADYDGVSGLAPILAECRRALASPSAATPAPPPAAPPAPAAAAGGDVLDRILDLVDLPAGVPAPSPGRSAMASAIATVSKSARPRPVPALQSALAALEDLLARQRAAILVQPQWCALEGAWRGLRDLLATLDGSGRAEVLICPTSAEDLLADLDRCLGAADVDRPLDLVLIDLPFGAGAADRELLAGVAERAAAAALPVLVTLAADLLAGDDGADLARLDHPARRLEAPEFVKWHALRAQPGCGWIAGCFNDYLLREPAAGVPALWGNAGWLVAGRILAAAQRSGWPVPISGARAGRIEDLRLADLDGKPRPLREGIGNAQCEDLATAGILALTGPGPADTAWIVTAPTLLAIPPLADAALTAARREDASLTMQLVRARLLRCVRMLLEDAGGGAAALSSVEGRLAEWLNETGAGGGVRLLPESGRVTLVVTFGERVAPGLRVDLDLQLD